LIIARLIGVVTDKLSKLLDAVKTQVILLISYRPTITHYIPPVLVMKFKTMSNVIMGEPTNQYQGYCLWACTTTTMTAPSYNMAAILQLIG